MKASEFIDNSDPKKMTDAEVGFCVDLTKDWTVRVLGSPKLSQALASRAVDSLDLVAALTLSAYNAGKQNAAES